MAALKAILTALGILKSLLQWWRERSIHDAGMKAERARVQEAERKANAESENIKPVTPDSVIDRLRNGGAL